MEGVKLKKLRYILDHDEVSLEEGSHTKGVRNVLRRWIRGKTLLACL
jgi:hypothetical protein